MGAEGMLFPSGYTMERPTNAMQWPNPQQAFLRARANSIEGGTTEIAHNLLGKRVLGLPGDVRNDQAVRWLQLHRSCSTPVSGLFTCGAAARGGRVGGTSPLPTRTTS